MQRERHRGTTSRSIVHALSIVAIVLAAVVAVSAPVRAGTTVTISGKVKNTAGTGISNATVEVYNIGTDNKTSLTTVTTTAGDGTYAVSVGPGCFYAVVVKPANGSLSDGLTKVVVEQFSVSGQDVVLGTANVTGTVEHETNKTGASQSEVSVYGSREPYNKYSVWSRPDGTFRLHAPVDSLRVQAMAPHENPLMESDSFEKELTLTSDTQVETGVLLTLRTPTVFGRLYMEKTQTVVPQAWVTFTDDKGRHTTVMTGDDGAFAIAAAPGGDYELYFYTESLSKYDAITDFTPTWTYQAGSEPGSPFRFDVKAPNFRGVVAGLTGSVGLAGSRTVVRNLDDPTVIARGGSDSNGKFGYYLPPGNYRVIGVPPYPNSLNLESTTIYLTVTDSGVIDKTINLGAKSNPAYTMSRLAEGTPSPCGDKNVYLRDESVIALSGDASRALVDLCSGQSEENYQNLHTVRLVETSTGVVEPKLTIPTDAVTMSRDGSTVAWVANINLSTYSIHVARYPSWVPVETVISRPSNWNQEDLTPALSASGSEIAFHTRNDEHDLIRLCDINVDNEVACASSGYELVNETPSRGLRLSATADSISFLRSDGSSGWRSVVFDLVDDKWTNSLEEASADVPPSLSSDGLRLVWLMPDAKSVGTASRPSIDSTDWTVKRSMEPLDGRRLGPSQIEKIALSGDGSRFFFVTAVTDLIHRSSEWDYYPISTPQLWAASFVEGTPARLASILDGTRAPMSGFTFGPASNSAIAVSNDGQTFAISFGIQDTEYSPIAQRLFIGGDASSKVYKFPPGAQVTAVAGSQNVRLTWPASSGRGVTYSISRTPSGGTVPYSTTETEAVISNLSASTTYVFTVTALTPTGVVGDTLTKTVTTQKARSRLLSVTPSDGGRMTFGWDDEPLATGCEVRGTGAGPTSGSFTLTGAPWVKTDLPASSVWNVAVYCTLAGSLTRITDIVEARVPALSISSVTWTAPTTGRFGTRSGSLTITMRGESRRTGSAVITRLLLNGETKNVEVALQEETTGVYTGTFPLAGAARIDGVTGRLSDGGSGQVSLMSTQPKLTVEGVVNLEITGPAQSGWRVVTSARDGSVVKSLTLGKSLAQTVTVDGLKAAANVTISLYTGSGILVDSVEIPVIGAGQMIDASLTARALIDIRLTAASTAGPVSGVRIEASVDGTVLLLETGSDGTAIIPAVKTGAGVNLVVKPANPLAQKINAVAPVVVGEVNLEIPINVELFAPATLKGTVRTLKGDAVRFATVTVVQVTNDFQKKFESTTDKYGKYEIGGFYADHDTTVQVSPSFGIPTSQSLTSVAGTNVIDLTVNMPFTYMVPLKLIPSGASESVALDWRTAGSFSMNAMVGNRPLSFAALQEPDEGGTGGLLAAAGIPGETVKVCFDGFRSGDGAACATITLPAEDAVVPELRVELPKGRLIEGTVQDVSGAPYSGLLNLRLETVAGGEIIWRSANYGPNLSIPARVTGQLRLVVEPSSAGEGTKKVTASVTIDNDSPRVVTLPTPLRMTQSSHFNSDSNSVLADRSSVSPGGYLEFRGRWKNDGDAISGASARIYVPSGATFNTRSVLIGADPVLPTAITMQDQDDGTQRALVSLGNIAAGMTGTIRWRLNMKPGSSAAAVLGSVAIGSGTSFDELPTALVPVIGTTLIAPENPTKREFTVRGRAPAGSSVSVTFSGFEVAKATASAAGAWTATANLPLRPDGTTYGLVATARLGDLSLSSEKSLVRLDTRSVKMNAVCVRQADPKRTDGRRFCFDPAVGVSGFPFVFVPGQLLQVEVFTDNPSRVDSVRISIGGTAVNATKKLIDQPTIDTGPAGTKRDAYVADFNSGLVKGLINVEVKARPVAPVVPQVPTVDDLNGYVPGDFLAAEATDPTDINVTGDASLSFKQGFDLPSTTSTDDFEITTTLAGVNKTPTTAQAAEMARTGSLIWGLTLGDPVSQTVDGKVQLTRTVSFTMLTKDLPQGGAVALSSRLTPGRASKMGVIDKAASALANLTKEKAFEVYFNVRTNQDAYAQAKTSKDKYDNIGKLFPLINQCVANKDADPLKRRINALLQGAAASDVVNSGIAIGSVAVAPETFGLGSVALWGAGFAFGKATDYMIDNAIENLRSDINATNLASSTSEDCKDKPRPNPDGGGEGTVATPTWIYDPSGYAFEGIESNRVSGVTATLLRAPDVGEEEECPEAATWSVVDMSPYDQVNPLTTDEEGRYGWDVPEGCWKVQYSKDGYITKYSKALKVLPPHLDVHVSMVATSAPSALSATLTQSGEVTVAFNRLMTAGQTADALTLTDSVSHNVVETTVSPLSTSTTSLGRQLAVAFSLVPSAPLVPGRTYVATVSTTAVDYADRQVEAAWSASISVPSPPVVTPDPPTVTPNPPTVTPGGGQPVVVPPAVATNIFKVNKTVSRTNILALAKIKAPSGSRTTLSVVASSVRICKVSGTSVKTLKAGTCKVNVTVTPRKGKPTKKTVTLKVTK